VHHNGPSGPSIKGELYVLETTQSVKDIFSKKLVPMIYLIATVLVVVLSLFTCSIFFMEVVGGVMWEQRVR
jgi:hypothetical protein